jgi:hypothetical protein
MPVLTPEWFFLRVLRVLRGDMLSCVMRGTLKEDQP